MSVLEGRQPPRFVPTLTDVVPAVPGDVLALHSASPPPPTSFAQVPTLRDVVEPSKLEGVAGPAISIQAGAEMAQALQARVMARLGEGLEERLRYALADTVQVQTQALYQAIRQDLEKIVGDAVHDAVAQELALMRSARTD